MSFTSRSGLRDTILFTDANILPGGDLRTVPPISLVTTNVSGSSFDANQWATTLTNGGTATNGTGEARIRTNTTANGTALLRSVRYGRFISGTMNWCMQSIRLTDTGVSNNRRQWGAYTVNSGFMFQLDGTVFKVAYRKSAVDTQITSGSFNGVAPVIDTNYHVYEIYFDDDNVYWLQDHKLLHHQQGTGTTLSDVLALQLSVENYNTTGITNDVSVYSRANGLFRLGALQTKPRVFRINAAATNTIKSTPGTLYGILIGTKGSAGANLTIYDNTAASGTVLGVIDAVNDLGFIPYGNNGAEFDIGLTIVSTTTAGDYIVLYE